MASRYWLKPIGEILVQKRMVTRPQIEEGLILQQRQPSKRIGEILMEKGYISKRDLMTAFADQLGTAYARAWAAWR